MRGRFKCSVLAAGLYIGQGGQSSGCGEATAGGYITGNFPVKLSLGGIFQRKIYELPAKRG